MKNSIKYAAFLLLILVITLAIMLFPNFYFAALDSKNINMTEKNGLNLTRENRDLSSLEKINLMAGNYMLFSNRERITDSLYKDIKTSLLSELVKIDKSLENYIENKMLYKSDVLEVDRVYIYSKGNSDSLVLRRVFFSNDIFVLNFTMDVTDNKIINFEFISIKNDLIGIKNDGAFRKKLEDYWDIDQKYLTVTIGDTASPEGYIALGLNVNFEQREVDSNDISEIIQ